ncbi:FAD-dependent monooxygenase [Streptomyces fagopyri]|uniref:FAD-dependent monooxygenase n=1 Tax=Streptomyces fagopyri TaxID=2662397 RepID=UPI002AD2392C|nr:FAD-dependent monooxygenase [Streptomyces fagopyri]
MREAGAGRRAKPRSGRGRCGRGRCGPGRCGPARRRAARTGADRPDRRIRDEPAARFAADGDRRLYLGPVTAKSVPSLRSRVPEPMRHGRLLLVGDAAHIVPPTGAEGAQPRGLRRTGPGPRSHRAAPRRVHQLPDHYAQLFLDRVRRPTRFSCGTTRMLHAQPDGDVFGHRIQLARLRRLTTRRPAAAEPAAHHTGLPPGR